MKFFFEVVFVVDNFIFDDKCFVIKHDDEQCIKNNITLIKNKKKNKMTRAKMISDYRENINKFCEQHEIKWLNWLKTKNDFKMNHCVI